MNTKKHSNARTKKQSNTSENLGWTNVDCDTSNEKLSRFDALLYIFEDLEAVIKMILKGRSPTMRLVSQTHRVALHWSLDGINLESKIQIKYVDTKNQLADILTEGSFTRDAWNHLLCLTNQCFLAAISVNLTRLSSHVEEAVTERKPRRTRRTRGCKIETCAKSSLYYDPPTVSNNAEFELISKPGNLTANCSILD